MTQQLQRILSWVVIGCLAAASVLLALPMTEDKTALDDFILARMKAEHAPGLAAALVKKDKLVWAKAFGWADIEKKVAMSADTIQNIGSVSKTITATAVMQLWEQGQFKLDDDVNKYLGFKVRNPRFPDDPITFRELLTHRSSIRDGKAYGESYACGDPTISLRDWIKGYLIPEGKYFNKEENFHTWKPGADRLADESGSYSNVGFGLLGYLVEILSGQDFAKYCQKNILEPLGMKHTGWYLSDIDVSHHAVPYTFLPVDFKLGQERAFETLLPRYGSDRQTPKPGDLFAHCLYSFPNYPDGLIRTSVRELSQFLRAYINNGLYQTERILRAETIASMLSSQHFGRGLCWFETKLKNGDSIWGHSGGDPGISTIMFFRPKDGAGVIIFYNFDSPGKGFGEILERLFEESAKY